MPRRTFMRLAIEKATEGIEKGQMPFGACIAKDDEVVSCVHNVVWDSTDITAHAEIHAIRVACAKLHTIDLSGCTMYATTEPCSMCFSACHRARIAQIVYGARAEDARAAGFEELGISNQQMKDLGQSPVEIEGDFQREACLALFEKWSKRKESKSY